MATHDVPVKDAAESVFNAALRDADGESSGGELGRESLTPEKQQEVRSIVQIPLDRIQAGKRLRPLGCLRQLVDSIRLMGVLEPIAVRPDHSLIYGLHRVEACRQLEMESIPAIVLDLDDIDAELAEIEENLIRRELTVLERAEHLARRESLLEGLGKLAPAHRPSKEETVSGFLTTEQLAREMGVTDRTIRNYRAIASDLRQPLRDLLRDTPVANSTTVLADLARLKFPVQDKLVRRLDGGGDLTPARVREEVRAFKNPRNSRKPAAAPSTRSAPEPEGAPGTHELPPPATSTECETAIEPVETQIEEDQAEPQRTAVGEDPTHGCSNNLAAQERRFEDIQALAESVLGEDLQRVYDEESLPALTGGTVYMDPPDGADLGDWLPAIKEDLTEAAIVCLPLEPSKPWFQVLDAALLCLPADLDGRCWAYYGHDDKKFRAQFRRRGLILHPLT